jgi:ABC-type multidrug transport system ATPase subunit
LLIETNELMGILGHNGAGKTTLINVLTGVINPDKTRDFEIIINNTSIESIDEIRKHIGVCSQFDILWNEMTAQEHLYMFARLKNVPVQQINHRINQILSFVSLEGEKKTKVQNFSGGMKRRLSLAIAAIGDPTIILLDEPTTGLDPKVRKQIWDLIEKMKKNKSIILTTHSMEEADILADRLCVMVKGRLKCVGTAFYLKHTYGDGHRIVLNIDDTKSKEVFEIIKKLFPKAVLVDCKGGNMIIGLNDFQNLL